MKDKKVSGGKLISRPNGALGATYVQQIAASCREALRSIAQIQASCFPLLDVWSMETGGILRIEGHRKFLDDQLHDLILTRKLELFTCPRSLSPAHPDWCHRRQADDRQWIDHFTWLLDCFKK